MTFQRWKKNRSTGWKQQHAINHHDDWAKRVLCITPAINCSIIPFMFLQMDCIFRSLFFFVITHIILCNNNTDNFFSIKIHPIAYYYTEAYDFWITWNTPPLLWISIIFNQHFFFVLFFNHSLLWKIAFEILHGMFAFIYLFLHKFNLDITCQLEKSFNSSVHIPQISLF